MDMETTTRKMKSILCQTMMLIASLCLTACSRSEKRWGGAFGARVLPSEVPFQLCYNLQGDLYSGTFDRARARPQFVILWKARRAGASTYNSNNRLSEIHGRKITVSSNDKAVYALQPNHSLKRLHLSAAETDLVLESIMDSTKSGLAIELEELWSKSVLPNLSTVEDPTWNPPPIPANH